MMISFFFSSNVPLPFEWIFYNPRTELRGSDDSAEVTPPIPLTDQSSPFTVNTPNGTLLPREAKPFTFSFLPIKVHACMYIALSVIILHACSQICENQIDYSMFQDRQQLELVYTTCASSCATFSACLYNLNPLLQLFSFVLFTHCRMAVISACPILN